MKQNKGFMIFTLLILGLLSMGVMNAVQAQEADARTGSYTTDKGTAVSLVANLTHEGGTTPMLYTEKEYNLTLTITLTSLGEDVNDIHDFEFYITISTSAFLGSGTPIFSSYYFDKSTKMTTENQTETYIFPIFITGEVSATGDMDILFKSREAIDNRPDPSTEYDGIGYEIDIQQNPSANPIDFGTNNTIEDRLIQISTDEGSSVRIETSLMHDGEIDGKPSITTGNLYLIQVNFTLLELGTDADDIHDLQVEILLQDSSITNYIPGSDPVNYFSAYGEDVTAMTNGDSKLFNFTMQPNTNINDTEVDLKFKFKFKEAVGFSLDPDYEYPLTIETKLNHGLSNDGFVGDNSPAPIDWSMGLMVLFIGIPLVRKRNQVIR